jgi:hypothetical protein
MSNKRAHPSITVVIPHRESEGIEATLLALDRAAVNIREKSGKAFVYEVISVSGNQPSVQRNTAVAEAAGEYVYFLDNDSIPSEDCFFRVLEFFAETSRAVILGGPSLTPERDGIWQQAFGAVLGSFFGTAFMRARYRAFGSLRRTSDRELILCNLVMRRSVFLELGGFDERLYPNEENALMDLARASGWELWHDPAFTVARSQRPHLAAFIRQLFGYGRGRGEQMRLTPAASKLILFVFMLFPAGVLAAPFILFHFPAAAYIIAVYPFFMLIAACHAPAGLAAKGGVSVWKRTRVVVCAWISFFFCHCCYGLGLWAGLLLPLRSRKVTARVLLKRHERG